MSPESPIKCTTKGSPSNEHRQSIVPVVGLGTRLLSTTKSLPKEIRADLRYLSVALLLLASCSADPPLAPEHDPSCSTGPTWCVGNSWFNRQTLGGRTKSLCFILEKLTYFSGRIGEEPIVEFSAPIQWGKEHKGYLYGDDQLYGRFPDAGEQSDIILIETYRTGLVDETVFIFRFEWQEHHLVHRLQSNYPGVAADEAECLIYGLIYWENGELSRYREESYGLVRADKG